MGAFPGTATGCGLSSQLYVGELVYFQVSNNGAGGPTTAAVTAYAQSPGLLACLVTGQPATGIGLTPAARLLLIREFSTFSGGIDSANPLTPVGYVAKRLGLRQSSAAFRWLGTFESGR